MYIKHDSLSDTKMRWDKCLVLVNGDPLYIESILDISSKSVVVSGSISKGGSWLPVRQQYSLSEFNLSHPPMGYVNKDQHTYLMRRIARNRQYRLGFCPTRVSFVVPNEAELRSLGKCQPRSSPLDCANDLFHRKYSSIQEAVARVQEGEVYSTAVSPSIAVGLTGYCAGPGIYRNNHLIGGVEKDVVAMPHHHRYFSEELEQLGFKVRLTGDTNVKKAK